METISKWCPKIAPWSSGYWMTASMVVSTRSQKTGKSNGVGLLEIKTLDTDTAELVGTVMSELGLECWVMAKDTLICL